MTTPNIKAIADEVTKGFALVDGPKIVDTDELKRFVESKGANRTLTIFPSISKAFPVVLWCSGQPGNLAHLADYFSNKTQLRQHFHSTFKYFPMNAQQYNAVDAMYKIETAGLLVDALRKCADGEENVLWGCESRGIPIDTPDNGFITKMMDCSSALDAIAGLKNRNFTIEPLRQIPKDLVQGAFYQNFSGSLGDYVNAYTTALAEMRKTKATGQTAPDENALIKLFKSCRGLYENGMAAVKALEGSSLSQYPAWVVSDGKGIKMGEYVQGIFCHEDEITAVEGNVAGMKEDENGILFSLKNTGSTHMGGHGFNGQGTQKLENLLLPKNGWIHRIWKFEQGGSQ